MPFPIHDGIGDTAPIQPTEWGRAAQSPSVEDKGRIMDMDRIIPKAAMCLVMMGLVVIACRWLNPWNRDATEPVVPTPIPWAAGEREDGDETDYELVMEEIGYDGSDNGSPESIYIPLGEDFDRELVETANEYGLDPWLVRAVIQTESRWDPSATNYNGTCLGLMQIDYRWWSGVLADLGGTTLYDPVDNLHVGCYIIRHNMDAYGDDEWYALNAFNSGSPFHGYADEVLALRDELKATQSKNSPPGGDLGT